MIGAVLVFAMAVLLGALMRCLGPAPRPSDVYVTGRRVEIVPVSVSAPTWSNGLMELYVAVTLDGVLLRGLNVTPDVRLAPNAAWLIATKRLREEARHGRIGGRRAPALGRVTPHQKPERGEQPPQWYGHRKIDGEMVAQ